MGSPGKTWESRRTSDQATAMQQALGGPGVRIGMDGRTGSFLQTNGGGVTTAQRTSTDYTTQCSFIFVKVNCRV
ncbi:MULTISPECIES: hypothetical protein [Xanthomonas]|uniref:hypothetical protein n=1 Tax=Xanthomonas TaxID=338 RepID=UPI00059B845D|nr:hypothetical protein [Xanthomonas euvesicatoria]MBV6801214.1 hypothetical protein [Xanthomonas campestris pv. lawsoniae]MBV6805883.1 hypothetical protein [Xanthomonas campestris pv. convolvuli]MBV6847754.1 hypothetical protein [Xanthomonas campestris pv. heliotropii]MBV6854307.1 hypothetical protein [Xanthomonas campestris pv. mirabilis]MBV6869977.1 hypothetical protein [Xanthomonas campestris pv. veroniae]MBV6897006.1 hypothetical protein [Xanthomonas campestris pv. ionidii]MCP3035851.1 